MLAFSEKGNPLPHKLVNYLALGAEYMESFQPGLSFSPVLL